MKKQIPNLITLLNLLLGCLTLIALFGGQFTLAAWLTLAAVAADFADGLVARLLNVKSPLGKELDSIADMVSFGVVPGAALYQLLRIGWEAPGAELFWPAAPAFLVSVFSGLRLGRFNLDTRQSQEFIGLPTPSCTVFCLGLILIYQFDSFGLASLVSDPAFLYPSIAALAWFLNAEIPLFSLKMTRFTWEGNQIPFIFAGVAALLLLLLQEAAFSAIVLLYVLTGLVRRYLLNGSNLT